MAPLARRLLFPHLPPSAPLPTLLENNVELDEELYDFIALALRAFVNPWWSKITRYDKEFLPHIADILAHVVRVFEHRLRDTDLSPLVFTHIPDIITQHYRDYRTASAKLHTSYANGSSTSLPSIFHSLQPHMALTSSGEINAEYYRQILDRLLAVCLPPEDYMPETERFIIREVLLKLIVNDIAPKITQPWFINKLILDQLDTESPAQAVPASNGSSTLTFHAVLVYFFSATHSISAACLALVHGYKRAMNTIKIINQPPSRAPTCPPTPNSKSSSLYSIPLEEQERDEANYVNPVIGLVTEVLCTPLRFAASTIIYTLSFVATIFAPFLSRLLPYLLSQALSTRLVIIILRAAKRTLFPPSNNGYPLPAPPDPTPEEQERMLDQIVTHKFPRPVVLLLGTKTEQTMENVIRPLQNRECNVHLFIFILDAVLATLIPELYDDPR